MRSALLLLIVLSWVFFIIGKGILIAVRVIGMNQERQSEVLATEFLLEDSKLRMHIRLVGEWRRHDVDPDLKSAGLVSVLSSQEKIIYFLQKASGHWDVEDAIMVHMQNISDGGCHWISPDYRKINRGGFQGGAFMYAEKSTSHDTNLELTFIHLVETFVIDRMVYRIQCTMPAPEKHDTEEHFEIYKIKLQSLLKEISFEPVGSTLI